MHLTNYSVNKHSDTFDNDESIDRGSKRYVATCTTRHSSMQHSIIPRMRYPQPTPYAIQEFGVFLWLAPTQRLQLYRALGQDTCKLMMGHCSNVQ